MLETARTGGDARFLQECSSIGRAPVSKTGGRRFEPCHSCQHFNSLVNSLVTDSDIAAIDGLRLGLDSWAKGIGWVSVPCTLHPTLSIRLGLGEATGTPFFDDGECLRGSP